MRIYEGKGNYRPQGGSGGFNPVQVADVASTQRREDSARRSRDQAFYRSAEQNDRTDIANARAYAQDVKSITDDQLKAFSAFSKLATEQLYAREKARIEKDMEEATMAAWADPMTVPQEEIDKVDQGIEQIEEGQVVADGIVRNMEEQGTSPIITEKFRAATGQGRIAYEQARAQRGALEYPIFYEQKREYLNGATSLEDRAARESVVAQEYLQTRGFMGNNSAFLAKYLFPAMKKYEIKQTQAWAKQRETQIQQDRVTQAQDKLFLGVNTPGESGKAAWKYVQDRAALVGRTKARKELKDTLFTMAENGELSITEWNAIKDYPITTDDGDRTTIGEKFGKDFQGLELKIYQSRASKAQVALAGLEQRRADTLANFKNVTSEMAQSGARMSEDQYDAFVKDWEDRGLGPLPTDIKEYKTIEDQDVDAWERKLDDLRSNAGRGYLIPADLEGAPLAIQDKYGKFVDEDKTFTSESASDVDKFADTRITALTDEKFAGLVGRKEKTIAYRDFQRRATLDYRKIFNTNVRSGRFTSLEEASNDALRQVEEKAKLNDKSGAQSVYSAPVSATPDQEYKRNLDLARRSILAAPTMVNEHILPGVSAQNIKDAENFIINGAGTMPKIFVDLASDSPKVTPWDIAQAQVRVLNPEAGKNLKTPKAEEMVKKAEPYLQRLLNYKSNINRTTQAFTPDMNDPSVTNPVLLKPVEGGALTGLTTDDFKWLAYAVTSEAERQTDDEYAVAASILNRLADPTWNRGARGVRDIIFAEGQYEGVYKGLSVHDQKLVADFMSQEGQSRIVQWLRRLEGRQDFKGRTQYQNMGLGDIKAHPLGNFFHYTGQRGKGRWTGPVPTYWQRWIAKN